MSIKPEDRHPQQPTPNGDPAAAALARQSNGNGSPTGNASLTETERRPGRPSKSKDSTHFWRAARHLWPYRKIIAVSVVCALFVGLAVSTGLTTLVPIMRVLFSRQTVGDWANEQVAQKRLGAKLTGFNGTLEVVHVTDDTPAAAAGLARGDR